jgi:hypothetical protein
MSIIGLGGDNIRQRLEISKSNPKSLTLCPDTPARSIPQNEDELLQIQAAAGYDKTLIGYGNWYLGQVQFLTLYQDTVVMTKRYVACKLPEPERPGIEHSIPPCINC